MPDAAGFYHCQAAGCRGITTGSTAKRRCDLDPRSPAQPTVCMFLRQSIRGYVLVECTTCRGRVRLKHAIHACAVHVECLPTAADPAGAVMDCAQCRAAGLGFAAADATDR